MPNSNSTTEERNDSQLTADENQEPRNNNRQQKQHQIPPKNRDEAKERDRHRCRFCGATGLGAEGVANLEVHHIEDDPNHCGLHELPNLVTICSDCHEWHHKSRVSPDEAPVEITEADRNEMQPNDYAILKALVEIGPARPSEIADKVPPEISSVAIRERIWLLAGLDNVVAERDERLVAQSARNGKWALADEISQSERGRIPTETRTLIQRIRDERVRRALDRGVDRATVAEVIDMHERSTWHMQRRALAYDFPLDALARGTDEPLVVAETDGRSRGLPEAPEEVDKPMQIGKDRGMDVVAGRTEGGTGIADVGEDCTELAALGEQLEEILNVLEEIGDAL